MLEWYVCLLPLNALRNYASVYACMFGNPVMHHVKLLNSAFNPYLCSWGCFPCYVLVFIASSSPV